MKDEVDYDELARVQAEQTKEEKELDSKLFNVPQETMELIATLLDAASKLEIVQHISGEQALQTAAHSLRRYHEVYAKVTGKERHDVETA